MTQNYIWEFNESAKIWKKYEPKDNYEMEKAYDNYQNNSGPSTFTLNKQYSIDLANNTQTNIKTKKVRNLQRKFYKTPPKIYNKFVFTPNSPNQAASLFSSSPVEETSNYYGASKTIKRKTNYGWDLTISKYSDSLTIQLTEPPKKDANDSINGLFDEAPNDDEDIFKEKQKDEGDEEKQKVDFEQKKQIAHKLTNYVKVNYEEEKKRGIEFLEMQKKKEEEEKKNKALKKNEKKEDKKPEESDKDKKVQTYFSESEICTICQFAFKEEPNDIVLLEKCGHYFHEDCLVSCLDCSSHDFITCPICGYIYGVRIGTMPAGTMSISQDKHMHCDGYLNCGTYIINYSFPDGVQGKEHPHPGFGYGGTSRTAYLPINADGTKICRMMQIAFKRRLNFTVGRSITSGADNTTIWAIHHKTCTNGGSSNFGFPDKTYFARVEEELITKGVTADDITEEEKLL